jgi:cell division protein ZapA
MADKRDSGSSQGRPAGSEADGVGAASGAAASGITVDIYDQTYRLHGEDAEYVRRLAQIVDSKMRTVAAHGKTVDSLRVAVLAALNVADELVMLQEKYAAVTAGSTESGVRGGVRGRARSLAGLLDSVLGSELETGT